jgi:flavin-dependent dehydrogenase
MGRCPLRMDALVIGAGPAGSVAAARLASAGAAVALLDNPKPREHKVGESLSPLAAQLLQALGVARGFDSSRHVVSSGIRTAWGSSIVERSFLASPYGDGWLLDRPAFDLGLRDFAANSGAIVLERSRICGLFRHRCHYHFDVATQSKVTSYTASWILDCSGRSAIFALRHGSKRIKHDNLVAFWQLYESADETADEDTFTTIEKTANGWYYTAPIPRGRRVVVFLTDGDLPECRMAREPTMWRRMVEATTVIRGLLHERTYEPINRVRGISAASARLDRPFGFHWVAAGDAAAAFDPLSSRGIGGAIVSGSNASGAVLEEHAGRTGALPAYAEDLTDNYNRYLGELARRYRTEESSKSEFWIRRSRLVNQRTNEPTIRGSLGRSA